MKTTSRESGWARYVAKPSMLLLILDLQSSRSSFVPCQTDIANEEKPHIQNEGSPQRTAFYELGFVTTRSKVHENNCLYDCSKIPQ